MPIIAAKDRSALFSHTLHNPFDFIGLARCYATETEKNVLFVHNR